MKLQRPKVPGRTVLVRVAAALTVVAGLLALSVRAAAAEAPVALSVRAVAAEGPAGAGQVSTPAGVVRLIDEYLAAKSAASVNRTMSFFDRGDTTYVDATLGWKFPTWDSLKALFNKLMPKYAAGARSYQTEVLGDAQGAVVFFTNTPQEYGHEVRGIAVVDIRNGKFVRWVDYFDGRHVGVSVTESLRTPPAQFPADFGQSRVGGSASPTMTRLAGELSTDFAQGNSEQAARLFAPDAVLEDLTLHTAVVGRQSITAYLARALPSLPYGRGAQVRHVVGGAAGGGYEWKNPGASVPRGVNAIKLNSRGQIVQLTATWDGSLVTPAWITHQTALAIES
jgi:hypothetical protein